MAEINNDKYYSLKYFIFVAIIFQLVRLLFLHLMLKSCDLYVDEVYYWGWANHLDFGYYSKPPVIAWLIRAVTSVFGDSELSLKLGSIIVYPITSSVIYLIAYRLFLDKKIAFFSALSFLTIPAVSLSSMIISTDVVLLLFWSLGLYFFIRALQEDSIVFWFLAGVSAGFGMLSKYNMLFFLVSVILVLLYFKEYRKYFKSSGFYIAIFVAIIIFLPNLYWQYSHNFVSFSHTKEISEIDRKLFHPKKFFEFFTAQFGVFGPIFFGILLYLIVKMRKLINDKSMVILYLFVLPYFIFITTLSLLTRAFANWSAPVYVAATVLVVAYLLKNKKKRLLYYSIGINVLLATLFYAYHPLVSLMGIELKSKQDPCKRVMGWSELAKEVDKVYKKEKLRLIFNERSTMAEMIYYIKPHPFNSLVFNPSFEKKNQYELTNNLDNKARGESFLFVTKANSRIDSMKQYFKDIIFIKEIKIALYKDYSLDYKIYLLKNFKGY